jgi:predicted nucleic acid-binding protein
VTARVNGGSPAIFVDSGAFFALASTRDENHLAAGRIHARILDARQRLVTTNFVLAELHALTLGRHGPRFALQVLQRIDTGGALIVRVSNADELRARQVLARYDDKDFSLTDAVSFAIMERLRITSAFAFDRHFLQYGFMVLGLDP